MVEISVLIPNKDFGEFVGRTIESVLNQTYKDFEIIVCDDNSIDNSVEVIKKYPVKLILKRDNEPSIPSCRNWLLREAKGEYIAFISSDDFWEPNFLEIMVNELKERNIGGVYCNQNIVNISEEKTTEKNYEDAETKEKLFAICKQPECVIGFSCCLVSKKVFDDVGEFNEEVLYGEETEWGIRATRYYYFYHIKKFLNNKRIHQKQGYNEWKKNARYWTEKIKSEALNWIIEREDEC